MIIKTYIFGITFFLIVSNLIIFYKEDNLLISNLSIVDGLLIFLSTNLIHYILSIRNKSNKLITPGYVMYEILYTFIMKFSVLVLMLYFSFKYFDLNNNFIIITLVYMIILRIIIYIKLGIKA
jgi:hypothetical protein